MGNEFTVSEAATYLGRSVEQVRRYLREKVLSGYRVGNQWFVDRKALEEFEAKRGTAVNGNSRHSSVPARSALA